MNNHQECGNCRFMRDTLCCRNPPTLFPEIWKDGDLPIDRGVWPAVDEHDWCGEWSPEP